MAKVTKEFIEVSGRIDVISALVRGILELVEKGEKDDAITLIYHLQDYVQTFQADYNDGFIAD